MEAREGLPLESGSIDYAVRIQALPEVPNSDLTRFGKSSEGVLKPNGDLRLALPDPDKGIQAYL